MKCKDDSCDLTHCSKCGGHMMGGYLPHGTVCDSCQQEAEHLNTNHVFCIHHPEHKRMLIYRNNPKYGIGVHDCIGRVDFNKPEPTLTIGNLPGNEGIKSLTYNDIEIIMDNWNQVIEMNNEKTK